MDKPVDDAVTILFTSLERTVGIRDAKHYCVDVAKAIVKQVIVLTYQFVNAIHRYWTRRCRFVDWQLGGRLVDQSGAWEDHLQVRARLTTCLEEGQLAAHVNIQVLKWRRVAGDGTGMPGKVEYHLTSV